MSSNDIIQALKLCLTRTGCCFGCTMLENEALDTDECRRELAEKIINIINNQGAEIEDLKNILQNTTKTTNEIKIEAAEQFAEMLEKRMVQMCRDEDAYIPYPFTFIDELLKKYSESLRKSNELHSKDTEESHGS